MNMQLKIIIAALSALKDTKDPKEVTPVIDEYLPELLNSENLLTEAHLVLDEAVAYTKHNLYVHTGDKPWSVQALLWPKKTQTQIHNHKCWCTFGVYQGQILEQHFDKNGRLTAEQSYMKSNYGFMIPNQNDIHRIVNPGDTMSITIHIYGINGFYDNSIRKTFKENT